MAEIDNNTISIGKGLYVVSSVYIILIMVHREKEIKQDRRKTVRKAQRKKATKRVGRGSRKGVDRVTLFYLPDLPDGRYSLCDAGNIRYYGVLI